MAEVRGGRAARDDQAVVADGQGLAELVGMDDPGVDVDALHLGQRNTE